MCTNLPALAQVSRLAPNFSSISAVLQERPEEIPRLMVKNPNFAGVSMIQKLCIMELTYSSKASGPRDLVQGGSLLKMQAYAYCR